MKFITAIYNKLHGTEYGGRLNRDRHYLYSLKCLAGMGVDIICYTSSNDIQDIEDYLALHNINNIQLKVFELSDFEYHERIQEIKVINKDIYATDNVWEHRCVELMWLKLEWLHIESNQYPNEKILWIDAGISHGGIIPKKYNSDPDSTDYEQSFQHTKAFNCQLVDALDKLTDNNKIFTFYCRNRQHQYPSLYEGETLLGGSVAAGLFGGSHDAIESLYEKYRNVVSFILENTALLQEELIMTLIYQKYPDLFNSYDFETWYHEDWDCYNRDLISFSKFFDDVSANELL